MSYGDASANACPARDYKDVDLRCVTVTELLGNAVYKPTVHDREGDSPAHRGKTKKRFERYIETVLVGKDRAAARCLARSIVAAQEIKHASTPTRREAESPRTP